MTGRRGGLGRGLSALIPGADDGGLLEIPLAAIAPNARQPREHFDEASLEALAASIREVGVLQPIVVRRQDEGYELVAGERRLRAAKKAGLATIPAVIRETEDADTLREALIENIHREDLSALETAAAFEELIDDLGVTQEELAQRLGFSRPHIANTIRLLQLAPAVQRLVNEGKLQAGHARALLGLIDEDLQEQVALRVAAEDLSVRQVEQLVKDQQAGAGATPKSARPPKPQSAKALEVQEQLQDALAVPVKVQMGKRKGKIVLEFGSAEDLDRIVRTVTRP